MSENWEKVFGVLLILGVIWFISADDSPSNNYYDDYDYYTDEGYLRGDPPILYDNPDTTDDESNNQILGFHGTETVEACNLSSGNCYEVDVDAYDNEIETIYFYKGGHVHLDYSDCDYTGYCYGVDENGTEWEFYKN